MKIASLAAAAFLTAASVVPAVAEYAPFIKKPKVLGDRVSTVTTFRSGPHIFCQGNCSAGAPLVHWECPGSIVDTACAIVCRPIPRGDCRSF
jgi:hypothetical protein